ncbi:MAG: hypothetical protein CBC01_07460 [Betaproteobacteria bacterium TMED41]|nr:MAG: hypothetical protein CBC01_07460 [Betaproteobacteria bacterium TMED41]
MKNKKIFSIDQQPEMLVYINTTPLIDVMLVLLIMLIITIPIRLHSVNLDLPEKNSKEISNAKKYIEISINQYGIIKVDNQVIHNKQNLKNVLMNLVNSESTPNIFINSHADSNYSDIASILFEARKVGLKEIGFIGIDRF